VTNIQEKFGADIIGHTLHLSELVGIVTVGLEVLDEGANEAREFEDVFVLLRRDNLLIDLQIGAAVQDNAFSLQLLLQMLKERASVIVGREGIYQLGAVLTMEENLIVDFLFVSIQFGFGVAIVLTVFGDTEMLDVYGTISLSDDEVRGVWLV
jgi:hypothetical protein